MKNKIKEQNINKSQNKSLTIVFSTIALFLTSCFIWFTFIPYAQMITWKKGMNKFVGGDDAEFPSSSFIYQTYNDTTQSRIRLASFSNLFNQYVSGKRSSWTNLYEESFNRAKDWIDKNPYRFDNLLFIAKGYEYQAHLRNDDSYYYKADEYYQKALTIAPTQQELLYSYAEHLANTGKKEEGVAILENLQKQYPDISNTEYYLGLVLSSGDKTEYDSALLHLENAFDNGMLLNDVSVIKAIYEHFFVHYYQKKDVKRFNSVVKRLIEIDPSQKDSFQKIVDYIESNNIIPLIDINS